MSKLTRMFLATLAGIITIGIVSVMLGSSVIGSIVGFVVILIVDRWLRSLGEEKVKGDQAGRHEGKQFELPPQDASQSGNTTTSGESSTVKKAENRGTLAIENKFDSSSVELNSVPDLQHEDFAFSGVSPREDPDSTVTDENMGAIASVEHKSTVAEKKYTATSVQVIKSHLESAKKFLASNRHSDAKREIDAVLDVYPKNKEALELAENLTQARINEAQNLFSANKYNDAMDQVIAVLDYQSENEDALNLAASIMLLGLRGSSEDPIRSSISNDPLLDNLFNQCNSCHRTWPGNPMYSLMENVFVTNPAGGRCPNCKKVWCRSCASSD